MRLRAEAFWRFGGADGCSATGPRSALSPRVRLGVARPMVGRREKHVSRLLLAPGWAGCSSPFWAAGVLGQQLLFSPCQCP